MFIEFETNYGKVTIKLESIEAIEKGLSFGNPIVRVYLTTGREYEAPVELYDSLVVAWVTFAN